MRTRTPIFDSRAKHASNVHRMENARCRGVLYGTLYEGTPQSILECATKNFNHALCYSGEYFLLLEDKTTGRINFGKDAGGEKNIYYRATTDSLIIAPTIADVLDGNESPDLASLRQVLAYRSPDSERTCFSRVRRLKGNVIGTWAPGEPVEFARAQPSPISATESLDAELALAVDRRLRASPESSPQGIMLSAGLDSSLVLSYLADRRRMIAYTTAFGHHTDEDQQAEKTARRFRTAFNKVEATPEQLDGSMLEAISHIEEPKANPAYLSLVLLARQAHGTVQTFWTGDGADELFAGYDKQIRAIRQITQTGNMRIDEYLSARRPFSVEQLKRLGIEESLLEDKRPELPTGYDARSALDALQRFDHTHMLPDNNFPKITEQYGIRMAAPFFDRRIAAIASQMPIEKLCDGDQGKLVVRELASRRGLTEIARGQKKIFYTPLDEWMGTSRKQAHRSIKDSSILGDLVDKKELVRMLPDMTAYQLWTLLFIEAWNQVFMQGRDRNTPFLGR